MASAELAEATGTEVREVQPHEPVIVVVDSAPNEPCGFGPIDEPNGAVMSKQQRLGHIADRRAARLPTSTDRQEELMLGRRQPYCNGLFLAPVQEATQTGAELEEALIVALGKLHVHIYIVTR
jgi:hypothetical protein